MQLRNLISMTNLVPFCSNLCASRRAQLDWLRWSQNRIFVVAGNIVAKNIKICPNAKSPCPIITDILTFKNPGRWRHPPWKCTPGFLLLWTLKMCASPIYLIKVVEKKGTHFNGGWYHPPYFSEYDIAVIVGCRKFCVWTDVSIFFNWIIYNHKPTYLWPAQVI